MLVRVFRGAIRPAMLLGMPFVFGVVFLLGMALIGMYIIAFAGASQAGFALSAFIYAVFGGSVWFIARDITRRDPFGLHQLALKVRFLGSESRGLYRFVPVGRGVKRRRRALTAPPASARNS